MWVETPRWMFDAAQCDDATCGIRVRRLTTLRNLKRTIAEQRAFMKPAVYNRSYPGKPVTEALMAKIPGQRRQAVGAVRGSPRRTVLYVTQPSAYQAMNNPKSQQLQSAMEAHLRSLGWNEVEIIDEDLGRSAGGNVTRTGFARNSREWQQVVEVFRIVDTLLIDQETVYSPRQSNDSLLLGLKGTLNEYQLDLLRQHASEARV